MKLKTLLNTLAITLFLNSYANCDNFNLTIINTTSHKVTLFYKQSSLNESPQLPSKIKPQESITINLQNPWDYSDFNFNFAYLYDDGDTTRYYEGKLSKLYIPLSWCNLGKTYVIKEWKR